MKQQGWTSVRARGNGILFAAFPALLLFYIFTPLRPVQFIVLFLIFILLGSRIYSEYLIRHLSLARSDAEIRGFRHEWIEVELAAENRGRLPAFMLAIGDSPGRLPVFRNIKCLCTLRGSRRYVLRWQGYASLRGLYELGPASLRCADPLGLFPFTITASETARLFVYPAPGFTGLRSPGGIPLGSLVSPNPFHEDLNRRRSLREYNPGDEMRRINWKATAKNSAQAGSIGAGGGIMVNEYDATLSYPLVVFLNADPAEYSLKNRELHLERAIEAAAALCLMASRERQTLGFIVHTGNGREGVINPGAFTLIPILERLAVLERRSFEEGEGQAPGLGGSVKRLLDEGKFLPFGTRLVYAGPGLADEGYRVLESLRRYHITLEYVVIQEQALPPVPGPGSRRYQMKESGYEIL